MTWAPVLTLFLLAAAPATAQRPPSPESPPELDVEAAERNNSESRPAARRPAGNLPPLTKPPPLKPYDLRRTWVTAARERLSEARRRLRSHISQVRKKTPSLRERFLIGAENPERGRQAPRPAEEERVSQ